MSNISLPLTTKISQSSNKTMKINMLIAQYGDGYSQRIPNGINYAKEQWSINWEHISNADVTTIETAIATVRYGADYFLWTPFNESVQKKFVYEGHEVTYLSGDLSSISMTLTQVFDL